MTTLRATFRPMRTELFGLLALGVLIAIAAMLVIARLAAFDLPPQCLQYDTTDIVCRARQLDVQAYMDFARTMTGLVILAAAVFPALTAIILGLAIVAKELDQRTAVLAWSMGVSRRRWWLQRVVPVAALVFALGLAAGPVIDAMRHLAEPGSGAFPLRFDFIVLDPIALGALAVSALGITLVIGAMLGRLLPTLLAAGAFVLLTFMLTIQLNQRFVYDHTLIVEASHAGEGQGVSAFIRTPEGEVIDWGQAYDRYGDPITGELPPDLVELVEYAPIEIYPSVFAHYLLLQLLVAGFTFTASLALVDRRAP